MNKRGIDRIKRKFLNDRGVFVGDVKDPESHPLIVAAAIYNEADMITEDGWHITAGYNREWATPPDYLIKLFTLEGEKQKKYWEHIAIEEDSYDFCSEWSYAGIINTAKEMLKNIGTPRIQCNIEMDIIESGEGVSGSIKMYNKDRSSLQGEVHLKDFKPENAIELPIDMNYSDSFIKWDLKDVSAYVCIVKLLQFI
jgi:hypothetical protein